MHKLLLDQNLSYRILTQLEQFFPRSSHVRLLKLDQSDDIAIWQYAKKHNFHIVSKDTDFNDINSLYGFPPKIIWIHLPNTTTDTIIKLLMEKSDVLRDFLDNEEVGLFELG